jgi:hypothetical protein
LKAEDSNINEDEDGRGWKGDTAAGDGSKPAVLDFLRSLYHHVISKQSKQDLQMRKGESRHIHKKI